VRGQIVVVDDAAEVHESSHSAFAGGLGERRGGAHFVIPELSGDSEGVHEVVRDVDAGEQRQHRASVGDVTTDHAIPTVPGDRANPHATPLQSLDEA
jgi:hypothetical protein